MVELIFMGTDSMLKEGVAKKRAQAKIVQSYLSKKSHYY